MKLSETEADALLDELAALDTPTRQPGDIDRFMYAEKMGISTTSAGDRLNEFVRRGVLVSMRVYDPATSKIVRVWRKA
jgi:hypothetical protein